MAILDDRDTSTQQKVEYGEKGGTEASNAPTAVPSLPDWTMDPNNPMNWSAIRRWTIIGLLVASNMIASISSTAFEPALPSLMSSLHSDNPSLASFAISIYSLGYVLGPLLAAPASEIWGRRYVLYFSFVAYSVTLVVCSISRNLALFIVFRAIQGFAGIGFVLLGPAVVADLMPVERRGLSLSIMSAGPVVGPTLGPVIGGFIDEHTTWRWIFWSTLIALGAIFPVVLIVFKETYGPVIQAQQNAQTQTRTEDQPIISNALALAWTRPLKLLFLAPIVPLLGFYSAMTHSIAFICFATVGTVFADEYDFTPAQSGMAYFGLTVGFLFCQITLGHFSDWYIKRISSKHGGTIRPEDRLPPIIIGATLLPIGLFWYGWSLEAHTH